jgi:predicted nucleic acid-binding protein
MILDSNLIIYAAKPEFSRLRQLITTHSPAVSIISKVEVLGYHKLTAFERAFFLGIFDASEILPVNQAIIDTAISLRQTRKMTLGDSLIAATAMIFKRELYTHNAKDFEGITDLFVIDPLALNDPT